MHTKQFELGEQTVKIETGLIAKQANASVTVEIDGTVILGTLVASTEPNTRDFFPLTVNYNEKSYAAGKIPGSFFKREGRPSEKETLISRLIDRPLRPLFASTYNQEVQIVLTLVSYNPEIDPEVPSLIAASTVVKLAGLPFNGTLGAVKVGYHNDEFILNPTSTQLESSLLDLTVAGTNNAVLMVESEAKELTEKQMLDAVNYGHEKMQDIIKAIDDLVNEIGITPIEPTPAEDNSELYASIKEKYGKEISDAYQITIKQDRYEKLSLLKETILSNETSDEDDNSDKIASVFNDLKKDLVRERILNGEKRIDGRDNATVRPISVQTGVLPRTHGSALFTRGETQALVVTTLGTNKDAQIIDSLNGRVDDSFIFHYNFPPYSVG